MKTINLFNLDGSNGFRLDGVAAGDFSGQSVSTAGDVNGDGFDDVIVGAHGANPNGGYSGSSYVVFGKASGFSATMDLPSIDGSNGFRLDGVAKIDYSGYSVSTAGDVNGDGFDDVIVGAPRADSNGNNSGSSYVVFGKAFGFSATMELSSLDGSNGSRLDGVAERDYSGESVSSAGDVNGDGFDDVIVGTSRADPNGYGSGSSYVVFGKASGFSATMDLSSLDGSNGFRLDGVARRDFSGRSVSSAGDVNGDGYDDVIVGAFNADPNGLNSGSSYVVFGMASGFSATMDLSSLNGSNGFRLDGVAGDLSGWSVSNAGDVNGDGFDDLIVGASRADMNGADSGSSYVVFGKASGFSAAMNLSSLDGSNGFRLDGVSEDDFTGNSVSNAGDVNGDGFDDLIVGASRADMNGADSGSSYVVFGKASGFSATMNLYSLDGSNGFRLDGVSEDDYTGGSVSSAGDVNGDGFDDLIVRASGADPNGEESGSSYIIFGRSDFSDVDFPGTDGDDELTGTEAAESFEAGAGNDKMIGRGGADVFYGEAGDDYIRVGDLNFQLVDGGAGSDTLGLGGKDLNLDLADANGRINGIETINLYGTGDNTLTLTALDVVNLSSTSNVLRVNGNEGDRIVGLSSGWRDDGVHGKFHTYTQGEAVLEVGVDVATDSPNITITTPIDLPSLDGSNGFRIIEGGDTLLDTVSNAGDVNGDGYDDVMLGFRYHVGYKDPIYASDVGLDYVVFGKPDGFSATLDLSNLDGDNGFKLQGFHSTLGVVSDAGDINGDGFDDMFFGAPLRYMYGDDSRSYVVFGSPEKFDAKFSVSNLNGSNGFQLTGLATNEYAGRLVSTAGDVNGDGFDDLIVGGFRYDTNGDGHTASYVVFGKASGFSATFELSSLDGSNGFRLDEGLDVDMSRLMLDAISNAGDVNGDGFDDLIVGGRKTDTNDEKHTVSYVVFGKASGFSATMDLSSLDGSNGFRLDSRLDDELFGFRAISVSNAGDVNGDGFDDLIVGAYRTDPNGAWSGSSYVVFGKASGFSATMELSSLDGSNGFRLDGAAGDSSGYSVSTAGDVNGDGFDDLIVGAPRADPNGLNSGSSYVVFGKASGFSATMNLFDLDVSDGFRLDGVGGGDRLGSSVSSAGDMNGDGFDDLIAGASSIYDVNYGSAYIIFGRSDFGSNVDFSGTAGDDELTGTQVAERFEARVGNDKMIGRGGADVFYGEAGDDYIRVGDLNFQLVDGGAGRDTLGLGGKGLNLDLADANDRINDIETIYLYGTGDNTLTLTALDVVNLSSTSNVLRVNGNEGDRIVGLSSGWNDGGVQGKFHYYTHQSEAVPEAVLLVGLDVATDFPVI
ncbi:MAG: FG-GAP repeat protein [Nitrosomonas sp.]|nr:FG-GAP repeat protein [Nitrosomonas sp.]